MDDQINQRVGHEHVVKVLEITLELVVEGTVSETIEDFLTFLDRLVTEDDLLDLVIGLDQNIHVLRVQKSVVREQTLDFEKSNLLHGLWSIKIEAVVDDFNSHAKISFNGVAFSTSS